MASYTTRDELEPPMIRSSTAINSSAAEGLAKSMSVSPRRCCSASMLTFRSEPGGVAIATMLRSGRRRSIGRHALKDIMRALLQTCWVPKRTRNRRRLARTPEIAKSACGAAVVWRTVGRRSAPAERGVRGTCMTRPSSTASRASSTASRRGSFTRRASASGNAPSTSCLCAQREDVTVL